MYEDVCYEKAFLKEVVARIDFVAPIDGLEKSLPAKLANVISTHFPINEPTEAIAQELQLVIGPGPDQVQHSRTRFKQWRFYGKDREKTLSLAAPFVFVSYQQYTTYEHLKEEFAAVIDAIGKSFPDARTGRFGIRYINSIEIPDLANATTWSDYIAADLLNTQAFFHQAEYLTRLIHVAELKYGDTNLRFQFGMPNPDHPAIIKRPLFILDFDGYVQSAHDLGESLQYMDQCHERIQNLYEKSITDSLRERMHAKPAATV